GIRHVTPRHEQGAGFMADGYARASGKPGVAFVITGPGLTNALTPMAQARAESVPMLVLSGVNASGTLGQGMGHLHELPDQHGLARSVALVSEHVARPQDLNGALDRVFAPFATGRPGPTHIQVPLDIAGKEGAALSAPVAAPTPKVSDDGIAEAARRLTVAKRIVILAGGGASKAAADVQTLAERLDAPVVQTVNARGILYNHDLSVPASPSLQAVRDLIEAADLVLALGTELGPTDYDMYATGTMARMPELIRVDLCTAQLARHAASLPLHGAVGPFVRSVIKALPAAETFSDGAMRAAATRAAAWEEIGAEYRGQVEIMNAMREALPGALMVGDSAQPIYAANLYYDHDRAGGWFNAATGYGALGYAIPAAIGAAIAAPGTRVVCIVGDGGAQFSLPEVMAAVDEKLPITFVIWNNHGYREIATAMQDVGVPVVGCDPTPPDFALTAASFGIPHQAVAPDPAEIAQALRKAPADGPSMIEIAAPVFVPAED
ncbi:MAG: 5-guanidino-2-oxopentanoate decarboxylase, partial [Pseudodonghicola sp.]|nr:5-guanidino-2-oxopentanoate decarboxylase [Pseudodonghicola sp.]